MSQNIRKKYMLAVTEEIEKNCEESAYMIQSGKARIAQKSIKQAVNYFKGASLLSFLLIGEFEQVDKLMELLPKLGMKKEKVTGGFRPVLLLLLPQVLVISICLKRFLLLMTLY